jgi:hypothetical protein
MKKIDCCYECKNRTLGCHGNCEKYILQKAEYEQEQEEIRNRKIDSYCPTAFRPLRGNKLYSAARGF